MISFDIKYMPKHIVEDPQRKSIELTAHLQEPIDKAVRNGFPLVDKRDILANDVLARFDPSITPPHSPNSLTYISFDPQSTEQNILFLTNVSNI